MKKRPKTAPPPTLRFNPTAWAKLLFLRDYGDTEVGGFGVAPQGDLLFVEDIQLVRQTCSVVHVAFHDDSVADYFDAQIDAGRRPEQFGRIWVHTHPGACPLPSSVDEETFARVFGDVDWAVMFILACGGDSYARLRFNLGPRAELILPVEVDFTQPFTGSDESGWEAEYAENVTAQTGAVFHRENNEAFWLDEDEPQRWYDRWEEYMELQEEFANE